MVKFINRRRVFKLSCILVGIIILLVAFIHLAPVELDAGACGEGFGTYVFTKYKQEIKDCIVSSYDKEISIDDIKILDDTKSVDWQGRNITISFDVIVGNEIHHLSVIGKRIWTETYTFKQCIYSVN